MIESPFVEYCNTVDEKMILESFRYDQYYNLCFEIKNNRKIYPDIHYIYNLLVSDWKHRAKYRKNIVMSAEGQQGEGKSLFFLYFAFLLGLIFKQPFNMDKNLYAIPENLDEGIRKSPFRSTHFLDEQRKKNVGMGSVASDLSLQDYEEQCRWTQKNILYASPEIKNHLHYFIFSAYGIERIENPICEKCPKTVQDQCFKHSLKTKCKKITFYQRSGYPKSFTFLLKTPRKIDREVVPRGFVTVPMVTPETVLAYDIIKAKNIKILEKQEDNLFKMKNTIIDNFIKAKGKICISLKGSISERIYKLKDPDGNPYLKTKIFDSRKYSVVSIKVIEAYLYDFLKAQRKFTVKEIEIMVAVIKEKLTIMCDKKNIGFFKEKAKKEIARTKKEELYT